MKYDTIIIGGGLSGMTCAIALAEEGQNVAVVAAGQSSLHFNSGSFDLLGCMDGTDVTKPLEAIETLPESHPYRKIETTKLGEYASAAQLLLKNAGIDTTGSADQNHLRLTPIGVTKPAWLTLKICWSCRPQRH